MTIEYRLANNNDLSQVSAVEATAVDNVNKKYGFFGGRTNPFFDVIYFEFLMKKIPHAFWVAEDRGKIVGLSTSWVRGSLWFLADLFILPSHQGKGVGRSLIERTLGSWRNATILNRALITFAYNPTSISLYMRFKMYPREPLYFASASSAALQKNLRPSSKMRYEEVTNLNESAAKLKRIDKDALGFPLEWHHEYFLEVQGAKCFVFTKDERAEGYAYVRKDGRVGPLAVTSRLSLEDVMTTTISLAAEQDTAKVLTLYTGSSVRQVSAALKCGLRINSPMLFMSTKPVGNWAKYVCYSPGLM